jgi:imidazolonepropionase-like amidohydrolase
MRFSFSTYQVFLSLFILSISIAPTQAQETFPINGPKPSKKTIFAFTNANIVPEPGKLLKNATLIIQEKNILDIGTNIPIPANAVVYDLKGLYIYPGFIDLYSSYGINFDKKEDKKINRFAAGSWNEAIKPEQSAINFFKINKKTAEDLRKCGFTTVASHIQNGIMRGTSVLVGLGDNCENCQIIKANATQNLSFDKGTSKQEYPSSLMGVIALIRQTYYDAQWYKNQTKEYNESLEAINKNKHLPSVIEANSVYSIFRADKIGKEFNINYLFISGGDDYKQIDELAKLNPKLILPVNLPKTPEINDITQLREVSLAELKHWELAPYNPSIVYNKNIPFSFTANDLKDKSLFWKNLQKFIKYGLPEDEALKALTITPAQWLGEENRLGALKKNYLANFIICSKPLFNKDNILLENWVLGERYTINLFPDSLLSGTYKVFYNSTEYETELKGNSKLKGTLKKDTTNYPIQLNVTPHLVEIQLNLNDNYTRLGSGIIKNYNPLTIEGIIYEPNEKITSIKLIYIQPIKTKPNEKTIQDSTTKIIPDILYPFNAYGFKTLPTNNNYLIKNATVWTNTLQGIKTLDVLIKNGKIEQVGNKLKAHTNVEVIDATGLHLTTGIIDEHSHIAIIGGVNEGGQENSAEVRIEDVLNSEDISIYRQLAGGVTTAQLLHGSANPIGGQSAIIKLRWGQNQNKLKIENSPLFIKFALGENVKQSNWGPGNRYPKTRMGVEQVFFDAFLKAKEYQNNIKTNATNTRKDLELETISEILNGKRFITCHSYIQSEINMLMKVADSLNFKVNTFTHILEGYKVADKMKQHHAHASTFSDWWAYKFEVNDAIPYNAALLTRMDICTAINSDDPEMARRLNHEAAKTIKYGGLTEEEAWKTITLNPAKMLHLDKQLGSIEPGKDADLVLWDGNPLSVYSKVLKTFVDGICLYDHKTNEQLRKEALKEKERLLIKINESKKQGEQTEPVKPKQQNHYNCETLGSIE